MLKRLTGYKMYKENYFITTSTQAAQVGSLPKLDATAFHRKRNYSHPMANCLEMQAMAILKNSGNPSGGDEVNAKEVNFDDMSSSPEHDLTIDPYTE